MLEVQPFRNVPDDQRRTDYEEYDELYSVVGQTIDIPASSVLPYECRLVWVPPHVSDQNLIAYVEENIGKPEYEDDTRAAIIADGEHGGNGDSNDGDDDIRNFIVQGDRWGFYQYAVNDKSSDVDYSPSPQFIDLAMSIDTDKVRQEDWYTSELCSYVFKNFIKPKFPAINTYEDCSHESVVKTFMDGIREELMKDERDITKMYEMCLCVQYGS